VIRRAALLVAALGLLAACASSKALVDPTTAPAPTPTSAATTTLPPTTTAAPATSTSSSTSTFTTTPDYGAATWQAVSAPSDCMCADGSPYTYWVRRADPTKVVFFMQGGGACFDAQTCAFDSNTYKTTVTDRDDPTTTPYGIFDFANGRNPFADYSFVFVPYCTGDLHLGKATHEYGPNLTVHHNGSVNATTALHAMATEFPAAHSIVVAGESAGSAPTPLYAGLAHDLLPAADIEVLADGSGAYPDVAGIDMLIGQLWGTQNALPPWPELANVTAAQWSLPGLYVYAHQHDPDIIFARHDYAFDAVQKFFAALVGIPADSLLTLIDGNGTQIEQRGVDLHSYIAPGDSHTVLSQPQFYNETVEGVSLVDWVTAVVRRKPDLDVHCTDCTVNG
jgi:hypothetical protein